MYEKSLSKRNFTITIKDMRPHSRLKKRTIIDFKKISWKTIFIALSKKRKKLLLYTLLIFLIIIVLIPPITYLYFAHDLQSKNSIMNRQKTGLTLLDRNGQPFYTFDLAKSITYVSIANIPKSAQEAVISAEDKHFYTNPGFSFSGIIRAFFADILAGHIVEGGSTITQELVKNALLNSSQNILRKYQELVLAAELTRRFSKQDILEMYLNSVYFGEGAFGIQNAAETYFGIPANKLDLAQSSLLIGLLPAPSAYSPISNPPKMALERQKFVLNQMVQNGYISQTQATAAENEPLHYTQAKSQTTNPIAPQFAIYIKNQLFKQYGEERVIRDGFKVTTTLDRNLQQYAQDSVKTQVRNLRYDNASNGALVALNPENGQILAMVGSYNWSNPNFGQTNMALSPRQPGSSFKPIIYVRAFEDKLITPDTILQDVKTTFDGGYTPHDYDYRYRGPVTVRRALANSLNIPAVEVMQKVGVTNGIEEAQKFGIDTLNPNLNYGLSLVLGSGEVPLLEMTNVYATFADQGIYHTTTGIMSIKDKYGNTVQASTNFLTSLQNFFRNLINPANWFNPVSNNGKQIVTPESAYLIDSILSDNQARAEEFGNALTINRTAAVKTGTTNDFKDAWTIGYTPSFVVGVWVGNNNDKPMNAIAGSLGAAPIWRDVMEYYLAGKPVEQFTRPAFIVSETICPGAAGGSKGGMYTEYFIAGTQPDSCAQPTIFPTFTPAPTKNLTPTPTPAPTGKPIQSTPTPTPRPIATPTTQPTQIITTPTQQPIIIPTVISPKP